MATKDILLGELSHDLEIGDNFDLSFVRGAEYFAQKLKIRLWFFLGEWFLDTAEGTPWFQSVLVKNPNLALVGTLLKSRILETPGVLSLVSFELEFDRGLRNLAVSFQAKTESGMVELSEVFP